MIRARGCALLLAASLAANAVGAAEPPVVQAQPAAAAPAPATPVPAGPPPFTIEDQVVGAGTLAQPGMVVAVHYTGWLYDPAASDLRGRKFDSSLERGRPIVFSLGAGRVIRGWDQGLTGMKVGGRRRLVIPPELGYGNRDLGNGLIPANSTLLFEVELVGVESIQTLPATK